MTVEQYRLGKHYESGLGEMAQGKIIVVLEYTGKNCFPRFFNFKLKVELI